MTRPAPIFAKGDPDMTYESASSFAQIWGMIFFIVLFVGVMAYALWPANRNKFDRAARAPLDDDTIED